MGVIIKNVRFTSEVLPVMRIVTLCFVVFFVERTPFCFEIVHVKVSILLHEMYYTSFNVMLRVSERTEFSVFTLCKMLWKFRTKLCLVFLNVIKPLNSIMRLAAHLFVRTSISLWKITEIRSVKVSQSPLIFNWMIKPAVLMIMLVWNMTRFYLKMLQKQMSHNLMWVLVYNLKDLLALRWIMWVIISLRERFRDINITVQSL